jgi:hypothetical protein
MNKEELIQNYIANRLSEQEKRRVEKLLETDLEFSELYLEHKQVAIAFQISKSDELKKRLQKLDATTSTSGITKFMQGKFSKIAIAAIVIFGLYYMNTLTNSNDDIFESYFEISPNTYMPITRGVNLPTRSLEFEAFKAYEANDFKAAAVDFKELLKTNSNPNIQFYYAMSLLNQDKFNLALDQLNTLHNKHFDYQVESLWYTALIQTKNNDVESAKKHLSTIQQLNPNFKSAEIESILKALL